MESLNEVCGCGGGGWGFHSLNSLKMKIHEHYCMTQIVFANVISGINKVFTYQTSNRKVKSTGNQMKYHMRK